jgi:hypothetical protein
MFEKKKKRGVPKHLREKRSTCSSKVKFTGRARENFFDE